MTAYCFVAVTSQAQNTPTLGDILRQAAGNEGEQSSTIQSPLERAAKADEEKATKTEEKAEETSQTPPSMATEEIQASMGEGVVEEGGNIAELETIAIPPPPEPKKEVTGRDVERLWVYDGIPLPVLLNDLAFASGESLPFIRVDPRIRITLNETATPREIEERVIKEHDLVVEEINGRRIFTEKRLVEQREKMKSTTPKPVTDQIEETSARLHKGMLVNEKQEPAPKTESGPGTPTQTVIKAPHPAPIPSEAIPEESVAVAETIVRPAPVVTATRPATPTREEPMTKRATSTSTATSTAQRTASQPAPKTTPTPSSTPRTATVPQQPAPRTQRPAENPRPQPQPERTTVLITEPTRAEGEAQQKLNEEVRKWRAKQKKIERELAISRF